MAIQNASYLEGIAETTTYGVDYNTLTAQDVYNICETYAYDGKLSILLWYTDREVSYTHLNDIKTELETYGYICTITTYDAPYEEHPVVDKYGFNINWDVT